MPAFQPGDCEGMMMQGNDHHFCPAMSLTDGNSLGCVPDTTTDKNVYDGKANDTNAFVENLSGAIDLRWWGSDPHNVLLEQVRLGDFGRRAYRMTMDHFWRLQGLLAPHMQAEPLPTVQDKEHFHRVLRLRAALRYFAGGDPAEIAMYHGIPDIHTLEDFIWDVINAIHKCDLLDIKYPTDHEDQKYIAAGFELVRSDTGIDSCAGVLGGMLIPIEKPRIKDESKLETYFCKRKEMYGCNMQAVCDHTGRFLEVWMNHPGSASDCSAFMDSEFYQQVSLPGYLHTGLSLFAHEHYPDVPCVTLPIITDQERGERTADWCPALKAETDGTTNEAVKDQQHAQIREQIDDAFSGLLQRWALLRRPLPAHLDHYQLQTLVSALCKLQNFALGDTEVMPPLLAGDVVYGILNSAVLLDDNYRPSRLLDSGRHRDERKPGTSCGKKRPIAVPLSPQRKRRAVQRL
jgi:hypothetical protein